MANKETPKEGMSEKFDLQAALERMEAASKKYLAELEPQRLPTNLDDPRLELLTSTKN